MSCALRFSTQLTTLKPNNMKNKILNYIFPILAIFLYTIPAIGQPSLPDEGDDPLPEASIDNWVLILAFLGIIIGMYLVFRLQRKVIT